MSRRHRARDAQSFDASFLSIGVPQQAKNGSPSSQEQSVVTRIAIPHSLHV